MPLVELQNFLNNYLVTDSPHSSRERNAHNATGNPRGSRASKKRYFVAPYVEGTKQLHRVEG
jgi:hypothetical protein